MALDDNLLFKPTTGSLLHAPVATALITVTANFFTTTVTSYTSIGHRTQAEAFNLGKDGATTSTLATYEAPAGARTSTVAGTTYVDFTILQWEIDTISWFEGQAENATDKGVYDGAQIERSLIFRFVDGSTQWAIYIPRVSIVGNGELGAPDPSGEDFFGFPIRATMLNKSGVTWGKPYRYIKSGT